MKVKDKVCVVTGAAGGIGEAIARRYAKEGAKGVVVADRDAGRLAGRGEGHQGRRGGLRRRPRKPTSAISSPRPSGTTGRSTSSSPTPASAAAATRMPRTRTGPIRWAIHVMAHVYAARALVPGMLERKSGYLLNTASAAGLLASMGSAPYGVTKHAAVALAEHLAIQYGDKGICVSVLCPQAVDTNMLRMAGATAASVDGVLNTDAVAQIGDRGDGCRDLPDPAASRGEGVHGPQARPRPLAARHATPARQDGRGTGGAHEQERRSLARSQEPVLVPGQGSGLCAGEGARRDAAPAPLRARHPGRLQRERSQGGRARTASNKVPLPRRPPLRQPARHDHPRPAEDLRFRR